MNWVRISQRKRPFTFQALRVAIRKRHNQQQLPHPDTMRGLGIPHVKKPPHIEVSTVNVPIQILEA